MGKRSVVIEEQKRTEGTIGHGACSQLGRFEVRGFKTKNRERDREGDRRREREKKVKNKVSIHKEM